LGCKLHETSADGLYSLEPVYCLGLCASSPAVQIDDKLYARMDKTRLARLVADIGSTS
jgi:formate dehydrogenase subunit gamma